MNSNDANADVTFEQAFTRLEDVVRQLEDGGSSLDRAIDLYEEGMRLSKQCDEMLKHAKLRVSKLQADVVGEDGEVEVSEEDVVVNSETTESGATDAATWDADDEESDDQTNLPW